MEGGGGPVGVGGAFPPEEGAADGGESEGGGKKLLHTGAESGEKAVKAIGGKALGGAKAVGHALHVSEVPQGVDDGFSVQGSAVKLEKTLVKDVKALGKGAIAVEKGVLKGAVALEKHVVKDVIALEKAAVHAPGNLAKLALSDPFADEETARREAEEREDARSKHEAKMEIKLQKKMEKQQLREAQAHAKREKKRAKAAAKAELIDGTPENIAMKERVAEEAAELQAHIDELEGKVKQTEDAMGGIWDALAEAAGDTAGRLEKYESKFESIDGEMAEIASSDVRGKKKKKGRAAKKAEKKAAKEALKKMQSEDGLPAVWQSPNTVGELDSMRRQSAPPDGEQVRCVWAMSFSNKVVSDVVGDGETEGEDEVEYDEDGEPIERIPNVDPEPNASLSISHEAWVAAEKIVNSGLVLEYVVPMDQKSVILGVGATLETLIDEAAHMKTLMRLQESKGTMEFQPELMHFYASHHGGLNEFSNNKWNRRQVNDIEWHFKREKDLTEREKQRRLNNRKEVFTSALAQRLVMSRLKRLAKYDPVHLMRLAKRGKPENKLIKLLGDRSSGKLREIDASSIHDLLLATGGYRAQADKIFPEFEGEPVVAQVAGFVRQDESFTLRPKGGLDNGPWVKSDKPPQMVPAITHQHVLNLTKVLKNWRMGAGREEVFYGTLQQYFPLHDPRELTYLKSCWGNMQVLAKPVVIGYDAEAAPKIYDKGPPVDIEHNTFGAGANILHEHSWPVSLLYQPIDEVRDYFGDEVALYFAWLGIYTRMLFPNTVFGLLVFGVQVLWTDYNVTNNPLTFTYSIYVGLWSISFLETWKRRQTELQFLWGTEFLKNVEEERQEFVDSSQTERKVNEETGKVYTEVIDPTRHALKKGFSNFLCFAFMAFTGISAMLAMMLRYLPPECAACDDGMNSTEIGLAQTALEKNKWTIVSALANLVIIQSYGQTFERLAIKLNKWENHRFESEFEDALVAKNFLFQFVNNYIVLFYLAFLREVPDPITGKPHPCEGGSCLRELQVQLAAVFTLKTFGKQIANTLKVFVKKWITTFKDNKKTKKIVMKGQADDSGHAPNIMGARLDEAMALGAGRDVKSQLKVLKKMRHPYEDNSQLAKFGGTFQDFNDRVIQFGYLVLFAPGYSLAPFWALVNNVIEIRASAFRMCFAYQRPAFKPRSGIGSWIVVMNVLGYLAVITNASMITFVGSKDAADRGKNIGECQDIPRDPLDGPCAKDLRPYGCWPAPGGVYDKENSYEAYEFDCLDQAYGLNSRGMSWELWLRFMIVEHLILLFRTVIMVVSPTKPKWIDDAREILEYRATTRYLSEATFAAAEQAEADYIRKMNDGFLVLKKALWFKKEPDLAKMWMEADDDQSGYVDEDELKEMFAGQGLHLSDEETAQAMLDMDDSGDGACSYEELLEWLERKELWDPNREIPELTGPEEEEPEGAFVSPISEDADDDDDEEEEEAEEDDEPEPEPEPEPDLT